jgi:trehalose/maltose hydrolase-like predicted phosphorylase
MVFYGAGVILDLARFLVQQGRNIIVLWTDYEIRPGNGGRVSSMTKYVDAEEPGIDNNAYTNIMVVWLMCRALEIMDILPADRGKPSWEDLALTRAELDRWDESAGKCQRFSTTDGIISQFEGLW